MMEMIMVADVETPTRATTTGHNLPGISVHTRRSDGSRDSEFEKFVVLPSSDEQSPALHAWADARFAIDIMAEHALFFMLLMPPEVAAVERAQAEAFHRQFTELFDRIESAGPPEEGEVRSFAATMVEAIKPFIEYKARMNEAQLAGTLRSLVWPLFFDHTQREAERWNQRLEQVSRGESEFDREEVSTFWSEIMDEHARFVAHLLDPDEFELIDTCVKTSRVFADLHHGHGHAGGIIAAALDEPGVVTNSLIQNPETDAILSAAETILDFKTDTARKIEGARLRSIIDPRLADHVRREALKFVNELKRSV